MYVLSGFYKRECVSLKVKSSISYKINQNDIVVVIGNSDENGRLARSFKSK